MNYLIDINHPAHVHLFKNLIYDLKNKGHKVFVTVKDIPNATQLLDEYQIPYLSLGKKRDSVLYKAINQLKYNYQIFKLVRKNNIEVGIGTSPSIAHVSKISKMTSIVLDDDDDDVQPFFTKYVHPYCSYLLSPDALKGKRKRKDTIYYPSLHELAYLHPRNFTPNPNVLEEFGLKPEEVFFILRFNVFKAHHDIGEMGLSIDQKKQLIKLLEPHGKVFISAERDIEEDLKKYQLKTSSSKIHSLLAYAKLFIGDSQTMTSEAAVLGTPAIRCNTFVGRISYLEEEEQKYDLTFGFTPNNFIRLLEKVSELLMMNDLEKIWRERRQKLLEDKVDPNLFFNWLINNLKKAKLNNYNSQFFSQFK